MTKLSQHFRNPQNAGQIGNADAVSSAGSASDKNLVILNASIKGPVIEDIRFKAFGCDWAIAAASYITTQAKGKDILEAAKITIEDVECYFGGLPQNKRNAADSAVLALSKLISTYLSKNQKKLYPAHTHRAAVAMSGGIDSSIAAKILKDEGYDILGLTMKTLPSKKGSESPDILQAKQVCSSLGIPHVVIDLTAQFGKTIIENFLNDYLKGKTPNPCVDCNKFIKFKELLQKALMLGSTYLASGHYCIVENRPDHIRVIRKGVDSAKDQSYMLWRLSQQQLKHIKFPLGKYHKKKIKEMGKKYFPFLGNKPESQDICFIGKRGYRQLLSDYSIEKGKIINSKGKVLGTHEGYPYYTIGQRKGLGISWPRPLYVKEIIPPKNIIVVGEKEELLQKELRMEDINFISGKPPSSSFAAEVMIRYNSIPASATIRMAGEKSAICTFDQPQSAITPGQSAVFYQKDLLLGGGIIVK